MAVRGKMGSALAACLLFAFSAFSLGASPPNRKNGWETVWESECNVQCGVGTRTLNIFCMKDFAAVEDSECSAATRPASSEPCEVDCRHVDPVAGDDAAAEGGRDPASPLRTLAKCVEFAQNHGPTFDAVAAAPVTRCMLAAGVYTDGFAPGSVTNEKDNIVIEPNAAAPEGSVIFDGTDGVTMASLSAAWKDHPSLPDVRIIVGLSSLHRDATRRPAVIVGGHNIMCSKETAIIDGNHPTKKGWATKSVPCFIWDPIASWATIFSEDDARVCD